MQLSLIENDSATSSLISASSPFFHSFPTPSYDLNHCDGNQIVTNASFADARWYTPAKGTAGHQDSFQDYAVLAGYVVVHYTTSEDTATSTTSTTSATSAVVEVRAVHKGGLPLSFEFDGVASSSGNKTLLASAYPGVLQVAVLGPDGSRIDLEPVDLVWNAPPVVAAHTSGDYRGGQKGAIVELFGWPDADIEKECTFMSKAGYLGLKLYPHQEQVS